MESVDTEGKKTHQRLYDHAMPPRLSSCDHANIHPQQGKFKLDLLNFTARYLQNSNVPFEQKQVPLVLQINLTRETQCPYTD